jgi:cold shock CspA family protein
MSRKQRETQRKERKRDTPAKTRAVDETDIVSDTVNTIITALGETEPEPIGMIERVVAFLGTETSLELLRETQQIEEQGGMWLRDGSRRRTTGGVFFRLLQQRLTKSQRLSLFFPEYEQVFPLSEQELSDYFSDLSSWPVVSDASLEFTAHGFPALIPPIDTPRNVPYLIVDFQIPPEELPAFAKGIPPIEQAVSLRMAASTQQWLQIAPHVLEEPNPSLLFRGFLSADPKMSERMLVRATHLWLRGRQVSTKKNKRNKQQGPRELFAGTVKWFSADKGFGFLSSDTQGDVFVHLSVLPEGVTTLEPGARVHFAIKAGRKGPEAKHLQLGEIPPPAKPIRASIEHDKPQEPLHIRLRFQGRPSEFKYLGRPDQPPSLIGFRIELNAPPMPPSVPAPSKPANYLMLISLKLWKIVREGIAADPEEQLVIHAFPSRDPRLPNTILLRATIADTLSQLRARQAAQQAKERKPQDVQLEDLQDDQELEPPVEN